MTTRTFDVRPGSVHGHEDRHEHGHPATHPGVAAWVDGEPVGSAQVQAELDALRTGPRAALLPRAESSEGRQLRRWVAQTVVTTRLFARQGAQWSLDPAGAPSVEAVLPSSTSAMAFGGVLSSILRRSADARAVYATVTADVSVPPKAVEEYLVRNSSTDQPHDRETARLLLTERERREVFLDWVAAQTAQRVRLEPGFEHPGDPRQPDATHRH